MSKSVEIKDVVCVFRRDLDKEKELIHVALTKMEAKDFIDEQVRNQLVRMRPSETAVELYGNGVTVKHFADFLNHLYDKEITFTYSEEYAKLLIS